MDREATLTKAQVGQAGIATEHAHRTKRLKDQARWARTKTLAALALLPYMADMRQHTRVLMIVATAVSKGLIVILITIQTRASTTMAPQAMLTRISQGQAAQKQPLVPIAPNTWAVGRTLAVQLQEAASLKTITV